MAFWKRKKKESKDTVQDKQVGIMEEDKAFSAEGMEEPVIKEVTYQEPPVSEIPLEVKTDEPIANDSDDGVILRGKKVSGYFSKGLWGFLSILVLPPVLVFALSILIIVATLTFPLLAVVLIALMLVVMVTLSIFLIALPVIFPLLILFLLITGKGRLLIASEGKWFALEMFGKRYTLE